MDFIIAALKKMKYNLILTVCLVFFSNLSVAENKILTLLKTRNQQGIYYSPKLDFTISDKIKEAIDNGIRVYFVVKTEVYEKNSWWFDKPLSQSKIDLEVSFFTLSKLYMVKNKLTGMQLGFNNINQLQEKLEKIISVKIENVLQKNTWIKMRIRLDKGALPTAMQLPVLLDSDWNINTPWYTQVVNN